VKFLIAHAPFRFLTFLHVTLIVTLGISAALRSVPLAYAADDQAAVSNKRDRAVGVLPIGVKGDLPQAARQILERQLADGLKEVGLVPKSAAQHRDCTEDACYRQAANHLDVGFLVKAHVTTDQRDYSIHLEVISGRSGQTNGTSQEKCRLCGITEAGERMSLAASALAKRIRTLSSQPGRIVLRSHPAGATVIINGDKRGKSPLEVALPAGAHTLVLKRRGHEPLERSLTVFSGVDHALDLQMVRRPSDFPHRALGWVSLAVGIGMIGSGAYLVAAHGDEVSCDPAQADPQGDCPKVLNSNALGTALVAAGAAATTLGGVWLYIGHQQGGDGADRVSFGTGLSGRF